jgi:hypothetical protein
MDTHKQTRYTELKLIITLQLAPTLPEVLLYLFLFVLSLFLSPSHVKSNTVSICIGVGIDIGGFGHFKENCSGL